MQNATQLTPGRSASSWEPPDDVSSHAGIPVPSFADFFAPPPAQIGKVLSAQTTLRVGQKPRGLAARLLGVMVSVGAGWVIGKLITLALPSGDAAWWGKAVVASGVLVGLMFAAGWLALSRFRHVCTYVGEEGLARFKLSGARSRPPEAQVFRFEQATFLVTQGVRHFYYTVHAFTDYHFIWIDDAAGRRVFEIKGAHASRQGTPEPDDYYHFGLAAETAWSRHELVNLQAMVQRDGFVEFPIGAGKLRAVRVGPGFLELVLKDRVEHVDADNVVALRISKGRASLKYRDPATSRREAALSFDCNCLLNAQLFLDCLEQVAGVRIETDTRKP